MTICANCEQREGTVLWGDALAMTHGGGVEWCEVCALTAQLEHARERALAIPELEASLAAALDEALSSDEGIHNAFDANQWD